MDDTKAMQVARRAIKRHHRRLDTRRPTAVRVPCGSESESGSEYECGSESGLLSDEEVAILRDYITQRGDGDGVGVSRGLETPPDLNTLKAIKQIIGRWIHPVELKHVYGDALRVFTKNYRIEEAASGREAATITLNDPRIGFIMGKRGARLKAITHRTGCLRIFVENQSTVSMYASGDSDTQATTKMESAARLINGEWLHHHRRHRSRSPLLRLEIPSRSHTFPVALGTMIKHLSRPHGHDGPGVHRSSSSCDAVPSSP